MIGEKIQIIRKQKGLSLSECAQRANISKSYLSNIERNLNQNPSIQIIERIAAVLNADLRILLGTKPIDELLPENEWLDFVEELKESGVDKGELQKYKTVIEFAKWQNDKFGKKT
ncbi:helix-turn-helix domain-containing protein [Virgibacillus litoralis]|uniref:XRE family transcriptional regulator of biofilm formation n=1 Tax=Virgibacillus litoralis TaxID=578221 RepID=A0ABS4HDX7_9BACI|nr:helix-turn-helix transcriptional regulator [Virgibacillus litoralis]MBP1949058.1 XRE family transcriptional regulator of biofilm formation [Virgibacillus litoralis]